MESMTAYEAMERILDINELIEKLKDKNTGDSPDPELISAIRLLVGYREVCAALLKETYVIHGNFL